MKNFEKNFILLFPKFSLIHIHLLLFLITFNIFNCFLVFPIEYLPDENYKFYKNKETINNPVEIMQKIYFKIIITQFKIDAQLRNIPMLINMNSDNFYLSIVNTSKENNDFYTFEEKDYYKKELYSTYNEFNCTKIKSIYNIYEEICSLKEKIIFNENNKTVLKDFPISIIKNNYIPGLLGLLLNGTLNNLTPSLLYKLKKEKLISNYNWFFDFEEISPLDNKLKGQLIIGGMPHDIFPKKYLLEDYRNINFYMEKYYPNLWKIRFDKILLYNKNNSYILDNTIVNFSNEMFNIISNTEFHYKIRNLFMDELIKEKKCFQKSFKQNLYSIDNLTFYYCEKNIKNILYENIPSIKFYSNNLDFILELKEKELFYIKDEYIYFNILFCTYDQNQWVFGQIITFKYNFVFNPYEKQIGFYKKIYNNKIDNKNIIPTENNIIIILIVIIIISIFFTFAGILIGKKIYKLKRKIIVNELIDEIDYEYKVQ